MHIRSTLFWAALAAALPMSAPACGPDFSAELLRDRAWTLDKLPEGAFDYEAAHLVAPASAFKAVEGGEEYVDGEAQSLRERVERGWWGAQYDAVARARDANDAGSAYSAAQGLPEEARRYLAGAVAWSKHDRAEAQRRFRSVLELPPGERTHYGLWAQYMLAKNADASGAAAMYAALRNEVAAGAGDPYGLAAASFGEEARVHLDAGDDAAAISLYAQQTALGSRSGRDSLLQIARQTIKDPARLERVIRDDLGQRLMTAYLFTRSSELIDTQIDGESAPEEVAKSKAASDQRMQRFLDAVTHAGIDKVAGADRVAALAYRSGKYDLAAQLAQKDTSGLAWWVRAKLALRAGKADEAAKAYAEAAKAFPASEEWGQNWDSDRFGGETIKPQCRVEGERGTLALSRGEYLAAMEHLYNAASLYWPDAAYLAERVLTVDELKSFVDAHAAMAAAKPAASDSEGGYGNPSDPAAALRALLARRLLRAERYDEALAYFDDAELRKKAQAYVDARRAATRGDRVEQARAWYAAARSARFDGIDLIGYELDPDYQIYAGNFDLGGDDSANADVAAQAAVLATSSAPPPRKDLAVPKTLAGPDEATRVAASRAQPLERFHYRYNAVDFASKSADLLPPRTQAFAAVLCHATAWLIDRDPPAAAKLYSRYLKQGPYVPWGADFGRSCPDPDFAGAAARLRAERIAWWKHTVRRSAPYALIAAGLVLFGIVLARRKRKAAPR